MNSNPVKITLKNIGIHAAIIVVFIAYETLWAAYFGSAAGFWDYVIYYTLNISFFYFNALVVVNKILKRDRYLIPLIPALVLEFIVYCLISLTASLLLFHFRNSNAEITYKIIEAEVLRSIYRGIMVLIYSMLYSLARYRITKIKETNEREKREIEYQNKVLHIENALLQAQIKPHLLFNTLSFVYDKELDQSKDSARAIMLLSDIMQYAMEELPVDGKASLQKEIQNVSHIIQLGELRHDYGIFIQNELYNSIDNITGKKIIPAVLSTLVENIFKYGDLTDPGKPARVTATLEGETFHFHTWNSKQMYTEPTSHNIGLNNLKERLEYAYGNNFSLTITDSNQDFQIDLKVRL